MAGPQRVCASKAYHQLQGLSEQQLQQATHLVWATGGGMVLAEANRRYMREHGRVFFLSAPVEVLAARLRRNPLEAQRPSLTGKSLDDEVREVLEARLPLYRDAAHHELDARQSITELCLAVRTLLRH